jgi:hypothetical protein
MFNKTAKQIEYLKKEVERLQHIENTKETMKRECMREIGRAFHAALLGESDSSLDWGLYPCHGKNEMEKAIQRITAETARETARETASVITERIIGTEEFIDKVVERIQRKQLK